MEVVQRANQNSPLWWFCRLPWRVKRKVPSERALKTDSETDFKSHLPFCKGLPIEKTNSETYKSIVSIHTWPSSTHSCSGTEMCRSSIGGRSWIENSALLFFLFWGPLGLLPSSSSSPSESSSSELLEEELSEDELSEIINKKKCFHLLHSLH